MKQDIMSVGYIKCILNTSPSEDNNWISKIPH